MAISYLKAIDIIQNFAIRNSIRFAQDGQSISVEEAVGRICRYSYHSLISTPSMDTSAMDGYAVNSESTKGASISNPLTLCVKGTMAAGYQPLALSSDCETGFLPCVEIMTGAQFPESTSDKQFDACIPIEDTIPGCGPSASYKYVQIAKPACQNKNRRFAGNDFGKEDLIISAGSTIRPHHVMAFASLGINEITVYRKLRIAVLSTGSELINLSSPETEHHIRNSNGPYVAAVLQELGANVTNLGIIKDDCAEFRDLLISKLNEAPYDAIITTGAVSKGKFDFVRGGILSIGARVLFHNVSIRPGHPVLFAALPSRYKKLGRGSDECGSETAFFGLPGNPLAAATCLRFFVIPYLQALLHGQFPEIALPARLDAEARKSERLESPLARSRMNYKPPHLHVFWHGKRQTGLDGCRVNISPDQGSGKVRPLLESNCWISIQQGEISLEKDDVVNTFPLYPDSLGRCE